MPYEHISKAQQNAVQRYVAKNYDRFTITVPKGERDQIKAAAEHAGESTNAYISNAIHKRMSAEGIAIVKSKKKASG